MPLVVLLKNEKRLTETENLAADPMNMCFFHKNVRMMLLVELEFFCRFTSLFAIIV